MASCAYIFLSEDSKVNVNKKEERKKRKQRVGTSCYFFFTYCVPSSEDGRGQFLRFVFMSFCHTTVRGKERFERSQTCLILLHTICVCRKPWTCSPVDFVVFIFHCYSFYLHCNLNWPIIISFVYRYIIFLRPYTACLNVRRFVHCWRAKGNLDVLNMCFLGGLSQRQVYQITYFIWGQSRWENQNILWI